MPFRSFDSAEELFAHLNAEAEHARNTLRDPLLRTLLDQLQPGQHFRSDASDHGCDFPIYGVVETSPYEEDQESIAESRTRGFVFTRCYSVACPGGELGDTHVTRVVELLTPEQFEEARKRDWT